VSFKDHDKRTYIADVANAFTRRQISKRDFLRKMGMAGIGFSAFSAGLLGNTRGFYGNSSLIGTEAMAQDAAVTQWLKDVGSKFKGTTIRYTSEATPPTVVLDKIKNEFIEPTGINVEIEIVPLEQVLSKATLDVQGQLGTYDLYYLDQSWVSTFAQDTVEPREYYKSKPDLAMPNFDWEDFSPGLVKGLAEYEGKWVGIPFDVPIFITMYRQDLWDKHKLPVPKTVEDFTAAAKAIFEAEKGNGIYGTGLQAKSGHYSLNCDWTQMVWNEGGSIFGSDKKFKGNDEAAVRGLQLYQEWAKIAPPESTNSTWDGQGSMMVAGQVGIVNSWAEYMPGVDGAESKTQGLWTPVPPVTGKPLRAAGDAGFGEIPNYGHQGASILGLSKYSKNLDAAWLFMQWACSKDVVARCTTIGGFAPVRTSSYQDPRILEKAKPGPGTTRHLPVVKQTIDNLMASEPDMPLWAGFSNNEIPVTLGKLLTGQDYGGDAKKAMDDLAAQIDKAVADAGLL
jgi:multiple sugar transport system substrate-binding protein